MDITNPIRRRLTMKQIRGRLFVIADKLAETAGMEKLAAQVRWCSNETKRRPAVHKAPVESEHMTEAKRVEARALHKQYPLASWNTIGNMIGVNGGRVSEAVAGFRDQEILRNDPDEEFPDEPA